MDKMLLSIINNNKQKNYSNPDSIMKKYDDFLESYGIYHSLNRDIFETSIKGKTELCDGIQMLYNEAKLENERIALLEDLQIIGYDKNKLVELVLNTFYIKNRPTNLWEYADLLYTIKNYEFMSDYINIIKNDTYGEDRQMLILLVGESKNREFIPVLTELLKDPSVYGHALCALSNFTGEDIVRIMKDYSNCNINWIKNTAKKYLLKYQNNL